MRNVDTDQVAGARVAADAGRLDRRARREYQGGGDGERHSHAAWRD
jgi:hypothetical protein